MSLWGALVLVAAAVGALAGCATTLVSQDVTRQGDGWTIVLQRLSDGPDQIRPTGYTVFEPERGMRFIHAYFKFRNDGATARVLGYDACDLDLDGESILPGLVTRYNGIMSAIDKNETYPAGDVNYRALTFSYPKGRLPKRIKCAHVTFDVPQPH